MNKKIAEGFLDELNSELRVFAMIPISASMAILWPDWTQTNREWEEDSLHLSRGGLETNQAYWQLQREHVENMKHFLTEIINEIRR